LDEIQLDKGEGVGGNFESNPTRSRGLDPYFGSYPVTSKGLETYFRSGGLFCIKSRYRSRDLEALFALKIDYFSWK